MNARTTALGLAAAWAFALAGLTGAANSSAGDCAGSPAPVAAAGELCDFNEKIPDNPMIDISGLIGPPSEGAEKPAGAQKPPATPEERIAHLEAEVGRLTKENKDLRSALGVLKGQVNALMTQLKRMGERLNALDGKGGGPRG